MQGLHARLIMVVALVWIAGIAQAQQRIPEREPTRLLLSDTVYINEQILDILPTTKLSRMGHEIYVPGASFIKLHFSQFDIPDGVVVEVFNLDRSEIYRYSNAQRDSFTVNRSLGDNGRNSFSAMSITGDTALVRMSGQLRRLDGAMHRVQIDSFLDGTPLEPFEESDSGTELNLGGSPSKPEFSCGAEERYEAACFSDSHPAEFDRTVPVALLINSRGEKCTAWRVGPDNRMFTAEHCLSNQDELDGSEIWFNYASTSCGGAQLSTEVKVTGKQLLAKDMTLDYALFTVNNFSAIAPFGYLGLDIGTVFVGGGIFIPQHGLGQPKQLALESDMNVSGYCEVDDTDKDAYGSGTDLGYYCDTTTSSSGSPVVSRNSGRVIALHHLGGCQNMGSKVELIWPQVSSYFNGVVPKGDSPWNQSGEDNHRPTALFSVSCDVLNCEFDAGSSSDDDGTLVDYSWQMGNGESESGVNFSYQYGQAGDYHVTLMVEDEQGATDSYSNTVSLVALNTEPVASFSTNCVDNHCSFDAGNSHDEDGVITAWTWNLGDGVATSGEEITHEYSSAGMYSITLTVRDDQDATSGTSRTIALSMPNENPMAEFDIDCLGLYCVVDAGPSFDNDGEITSYHWSFGDGHGVTGRTAQHNYADSGTFAIQLTIEDDRGANASISHSVTLEAPNEKPVAEFSYICSELVCSFDSSASSDTDGQIVQTSWSFGDGFSSSFPSVEHVFGEAGIFSVTLTVVDDQGASGSSQRTLSVSQTGADPIAQFKIECEERHCSLDAGLSIASGGSIHAYEWSFGDGTTGQGQSVNHEYAEDGDYVITLQVVDSNQRVGSSIRNIEVAEKTEFLLSASGAFQNGRVLATLTWSGALSEAVNILRDGEWIASTANTGKHLDVTIRNVSKTASYRLCESQSGRCSNEIEVQFGR